MKLASYKGRRKGISGFVSIGIKFWLMGKHSHSEVIFEPGDGVDELMPDKTTEMIDGTVWAFSSSASDIIPKWAKRRAGQKGGCRFKRINFTEDKYSIDKWDIIPYPVDAYKAALIAKENEGNSYDHRLNLGIFFRPMLLLFGYRDGFVNCSKVCAKVGQFEEPDRFDPCVLHVAVKNMSNAIKA